MSWQPPRLPKFRVYRGDGKNPAWGMTYDAVNARDAVRQDNERSAKANTGPAAEMFGTFKPLPVVAVYFLAEVPESDWR